jgi:opacity protein-like surface antigen
MSRREPERRIPKQNQTMKNLTSLKHHLLAAAASLGLAVAAHAQTTVAPSEPSLSRSAGLLGQTYASASLGFIDLDDTGIDARSLALSANQYVRDGVDSFLDYNYTRSDRFAGTRLTQHDLLLGARAYTHWQGVKPYAEAGVGWVWQKAGGARDNSFAWAAGVGAEIEVAAQTTVTPFVRYSDLADGGDNNQWEYGVKANHWFTEKFALQGSLSRDDDQNLFYRLGVNVRY